MKRTRTCLIVGSAGLIAVFATPFPPASAQSQLPIAKPSTTVVSPIGRHCVIILDPRDSSNKREGQANADKYLVLENKVEGELLEMTPDWVILKDGNYENWVPQDKVLHIRVSR